MRLNLPWAWHSSAPACFCFSSLDTDGVVSEGEFCLPVMLILSSCSMISKVPSVCSFSSSKWLSKLSSCSLSSLPKFLTLWHLLIVVCSVLVVPAGSGGSLLRKAVSLVCLLFLGGRCSFGGDRGGDHDEVRHHHHHCFSGEANKALQAAQCKICRRCPWFDLCDISN